MRSGTVGIVLLILGMFAVSAANGQFICNVPVNDLMSCRPAMTPPRPSSPSGACCAALSRADMRCLCTFKNSQELPALGMDPKLAVQLPTKCRLRNAPRC